MPVEARSYAPRLSLKLALTVWRQSLDYSGFVKIGSRLEEKHETGCQRCSMRRVIRDGGSGARGVER